MLVDFPYTILLFVVATNLAASAYVLVAIRRINRFRWQRDPPGVFRPPVTILKPVCGLDAGLYENLRSFCVQDHPQYQVIFGVREANDPAIPTIQRLIDEFPQLDLSITIDPTVTGPNLKISNLANMYKAAKYPYLVIADSDIRVDGQYLSSVTAPFEDKTVGVVTCLYTARSSGGFASLLASMFINEWFLPSVLVSAAIRDMRFGLGSTIAVRRELLETIGGFKRLSNYLADDHMLGKLVSDHGFKVILSGYVVENVVDERNLLALFRHELRWARTIRSVAPLGHGFSFLMYGVPLAFLAALTIHLTIDWDFFEFMIVAVAILLRVWMHFTVCGKLGVATNSRSIWLIPARDFLSFLVWATSFLGRGIDWRGVQFAVGPNSFTPITKDHTL